MHTIFRSDFSVGEMANWHIEQHVPDGYTDFSVKDEKMIFYDAGNRILPNVPALENFIIDGVFDVDWNINNRNYSLQIYFAYNEHTRQGLMLDFTSDGKETKIRLFNNKRLLTKTKTDAFKAENVNFKFKCENKKIALSLNGKKYFSYTVSESVKGAIALGRGAFLGELRMSEFAVSSSDEFGSKNIWNNLKIPFTAINGMDIPIVWTVNSKLVGSNITQVDIELSGGEKSRPDIPWFRYHGHYVELLTSPYLRIESGSEFHELKLSDQTLRLANPRKHWFYFFNNKPQWPLKRTFFLRNVSKNSLLFAGYQAYSNCAVNKHLEVKKPYETAYNVKSEKIIYA